MRLQDLVKYSTSNKKEKLQNSGKLQKKLLNFLFIISLIIVLSTVINVTALYLNNKIKMYRTEAYGYTRIAAEYIDGDKIQGYLDNPVEDEYFYDVKAFINRMQANTDILYFYVLVPSEEDPNEYIYIWDADADGTPGMAIGDTDDFSSEGAVLTEQVMSGGKSEKLIITYDKEYGFIAFAASPIYNSAGDPVALSTVELSMTDMAYTFYMFLISIVITVVFVMVIGMVAFYKKLNKNIIIPIQKLDDATKQVTTTLETGENIDPDIHTGDELEDLSNSFVYMEHELREYIEENTKIMAEKERIGAELNVATKIQTDMLPMIFPAFPERTEFDIYASMKPAKEVGGDFYDFFFIDDDHLALVIADVSGKGVPAAMYMMMAKCLIQTYTLSGRSPEEIFNDVNLKLCDKVSNKMFVTVWLGIVEISTGHVTAINAGHEYPLIMNPDGDFEVLKDKHGFVLGGLARAKYHEYELDLKPGSKLFLYTDGVPEAKNAEGELFGMERTTKAVNQVKDGDPKQIIKGVGKIVGEYTGGAEQFDDMTMLCLEYIGVK